MTNSAHFRFRKGCIAFSRRDFGYRRPYWRTCRLWRRGTVCRAADMQVEDVCIFANSLGTSFEPVEACTPLLCNRSDGGQGRAEARLEHSESGLKWSRFLTECLVAGSGRTQAGRKRSGNDPRCGRMPAEISEGSSGCSRAFRGNSGTGLQCPGTASKCPERDSADGSRNGEVPCQILNPKS